MTMLDKGSASLMWTLDGQIQGMPVAVLLESTIVMNLLTGRINKHE
jgi:hypothetical protein